MWKQKNIRGKILGGVRGYKVFNPDWTCRNFHYEVGKVYEENVKPSCCAAGFHFCLNAADCFNYYNFDSNNKVAEVIALGAVDYSNEDTKACTNKIQIVREIPWQEVLIIANTGCCNTGYSNIGNHNIGNHNIGDRNTGDRNTGYCNTGSCNTGSCNTGNYNTGNWNTGDWNTGDWNSCDGSTGCFCTEQQYKYMMFFDKPSTWSYDDWLKSDARVLINNIPLISNIPKSECVQRWWDSLPENSRSIITSLPNFDPDIFMQTTGIKI